MFEQFRNSPGPGLYVSADHPSTTVKEADKNRVQDLLCKLERLETQRPAPEETAIHAVAQQAIVEEISQLVRQDWLAVYRNGGTLDAVSLA